MDIENFRTLLSALIAALPAVMSLGLIAILAFPTTKTGLKDEDYYKKFITFLIPIIGLYIAAILVNIGALAELCANGDNSLLYWGILLSIASLIVMPIYLFVYVLMVPKIWK